MRGNKGRLSPFVPLLVGTIDSPAWRAMSHGARNLYVCLRRRFRSEGRNQVYVSYRKAAAELRSSHKKISEWFAELRHFGFIVLAKQGCLGVDGAGQSSRWRLTECGTTRKASPTDLFEPPTKDFLKWDGTPFDQKPFRPTVLPGASPFPSKKQNPAFHAETAPLSTRKPPPLSTRKAPKHKSGFRAGSKSNDKSGFRAGPISSYHSHCEPKATNGHCGGTDDNHEQTDGEDYKDGNTRRRIRRVRLTRTSGRID